MADLPEISDEKDLTIDAAVAERGKLAEMLKSGNWNNSFENRIRQRLGFVENFIVESVCSDFAGIDAELEANEKESEQNND